MKWHPVFAPLLPILNPFVTYAVKEDKTVTSFIDGSEKDNVPLAGAATSLIGGGFFTLFVGDITIYGPNDNRATWKNVPNAKKVRDQLDVIIRRSGSGGHSLSANPYGHQNAVSQHIRTDFSGNGLARDTRPSQLASLEPANVRSHAFTDGPTPINAVAWDPNNRWIATGGAEGIVRLWDARMEKQSRRLVGHAGEVRSVVFSPDGSWIAATTGKSGEPRNHATGGPISVWDTSTGQRSTLAIFPDRQIF